jgi:predicted phage terminase large subunit-like protein
MTAAAELTIQPELLELISNPDLIEAELSRRHLRHFMRNAWPIVEREGSYKPNWHIDAICDHLQAVSDGDIRRLIINMPPRCTKSLTISVNWPAHVWIDQPHRRFLFSSYAHQLAVRDAVKTRRLIQSKWYQRHFGDSFSLAADQNAKGRYDNDKSGYRIATSVGGSATGEGGDFVVVDDPHNVFEVESDTMRQSVLMWWDEVMSTRLNDPETGAMIVIMQRTHQSDLAGHLLEQGGYEHLNLPMEYEGKCCVEIAHECSQQEGTSIGFTDPREDEGELLTPTRVGPDALKQLKRQLGSYGVAGQLQQRPTSREGNMFRVGELNYIDRIVEDNVKKEWRAWDKAGTQGGGAYTVGTRMGRYKKPRPNGTYDEDGQQRCSLYFIRDVVRGQWSSGQRENKISDTCKRDGKKVFVTIEQEPGSGGKESAENTVKKNLGFHVEIDNVSGEGNKEVRADPFAVAVENGEVDVLRASWNAEWHDEMTHFPMSKYKDQVDSAAQGFNRIKRKMGVHIG